MTPAQRRIARPLAVLVAVFGLVVTGVGMWAFGAQDRISSDLVDVRDRSIAEDRGTEPEGHAAWVVGLINGGEAEAAETEARLSEGFLAQMPASTFLGEIDFIVPDGPFEFRGFVFDEERGEANGYAETPDGRSWTFSFVSLPANPHRLDGVIALLTDLDRGPFDALQLVAILVAGWALVIAGFGSWYTARQGPGTPWLLLAGAVWMLQLLELSDASLLYTFGLVAGPLAIGLLAVGVVAMFCEGPGWLRRIVSTIIVVATISALAPLFFIDTEVSSLPRNWLAIVHRPSVSHGLTAMRTVAALIAACAVAIWLWRPDRARGRTVERNVATLAVGGTIGAAVVVVAAASALGSTGFDLSLSPLFAIVPLAIAAAIGAMELDERHAVAEIASIIDQTSVGDDSRCELEAALRRALGDPTLELVYWSPDASGYISSEGADVEVTGLESREVTLLATEGQPVGAVIHDRSIAVHPRRVQAACSLARLALENERLSTLVRAQLADVRASRVRIVESAEQAQRRVERDLHDGAQQRLLALSLAAELQRGKSERNGHHDEAAFLGDVVAELGGAVEELRELGRGLRPSALDRGLAAAVGSLAERSPLPVVVDVTPERFPEAIEAAAYFVISEAVANATRHAGADHVRVRVEAVGDELVVRIGDDGGGGADSRDGSGLRSLEDRVLALDGRWEVQSPRGRGTEIRAVLPLPALPANVSKFRGERSA